MAAKKKSNSETRRNAPVGNTGGRGFSFEDLIAARFMVDLLGQRTHALGMEAFGNVLQLDWQGHGDSGWLLDDIVVTSEIAGNRRSAGISVKSGQRVTVQGFPPDFVAAAWSQWFGSGTIRTFAKTRDVVVLATGQGTQAAKTPWGRLLTEILGTAPDRIVVRLNVAQMMSQTERDIFKSFACPTEHSSKHRGDEETVELIRQTRWLNFDYESPTSQDYASATALCKEVLSDADTARAGDLWQTLGDIAEKKRIIGGTLDLPELLAILRGKFSFRDNPDYAADWAALKARSDAELGSIRTEIAGLPRLRRDADFAAVADAVNNRGACFLIGDSGSGKSALVKEFASCGYSRVIWLSGDLLEHASLPDFERAMGLTHSFAQVIDVTVDMTLLVLDAVEGYSDQARKVATQLVRVLCATSARPRTHIILTAHAEAAGFVTRELYFAGFPDELLETTPLDRPAEADVRAMVYCLSKVGWLALNPEVRSLLTNLKILDWFVRFAQSGGTVHVANLGLTNLIDSLWEHWVESGPQRFARSDLLKQVACIEADQHLSSVPISALGHAEQTTLGQLADAELLRVRNERIRFSHDLLSDWSRLKILIGDDWLAASATRERYASPKWSRAIRLFAQRLLEQSGHHGWDWRSALHAVDDGTTTGSLIRNLFLEALFLAPNAGALLREAWPVLIADGAKLLKVLIDRFLFIATVPDPRLRLVVGADQDITGYEHLMRYPYFPYWGPLISVLSEKTAEITRLVPNEAAKVCAMWLRSTSYTPNSSYRVPWRQATATLAYDIARAAQTAAAVREPFSYGGSKIIYEALLLAAPELPSEVGQLCLELAERRYLDPTIARQVAEARAKRAEERKRAEAADSSTQDHLPEPIFPLGRRRQPWPDGPRRGVAHEFVEACLDGNAFAAFASANPDAALETLLAVCIEEPQTESFGTSSLPETGLHYWDQGDPAIWFRGPFLSFLNAAPDQGISFVLKLTNFVTQYYERSGKGLTFTIDRKKKLWLGDDNVLAWHYDGHISHGSILQCALLALEKWMYDRIDVGADITPIVKRIMKESESMAFAGLLLTVSKKKPDLLGSLFPILHCWEVVEWDCQLTTQRNGGWHIFPGYWGHQPQESIKIAQDWIDLPHRKTSVRDLIVTHFLPLKKYDRFFERLLKAWEEQLRKHRRMPPELTVSVAAASFVAVARRVTVCAATIPGFYGAFLGRFRDQDRVRV